MSLIGRDWGRALHPAEVFQPEACACYMRAADRVLCVPPCGCDQTQGCAAVK